MDRLLAIAEYETAFQRYPDWWRDTPFEYAKAAFDLGQRYCEQPRCVLRFAVHSVTQRLAYPTIAHNIATNQPTPDQPRRRFTQKIARRLGCFFARATIVGRK